MSSPNFDNSGDHESWDGKGELEWTERNWKQFLKDSDGEVGRFIKIYQSLKHDPQRLDHTALGMGWDAEEWSAELDLDEDERPDWLGGSLDDEDFDDMDDNDPYTIHKHPLYVTSRALYVLLSYYWKIIVMEHPETMTVFDCQRFGEAARAGETNAIMGIHALEMGDYSLVVCHLQRSYASLNDCLGCFQKSATAKDSPIDKSFVDEFYACFFDLREVWLRVIKECRGTTDFG